MRGVEWGEGWSGVRGGVGGWGGVGEGWSDCQQCRMRTRHTYRR